MAHADWPLNGLDTGYLKNIHSTHKVNVKINRDSVILDTQIRGGGSGYFGGRPFGARRSVAPLKHSTNPQNSPVLGVPPLWLSEFTRDTEDGE